MKSNLKISNESNTGLIEFRSFIELDRYNQTKESSEQHTVYCTDSNTLLNKKVKTINFLQVKIA